MPHRASHNEHCHSGTWASRKCAAFDRAPDTISPRLRGFMVVIACLVGFAIPAWSQGQSWHRLNSVLKPNAVYIADARTQEDTPAGELSSLHHVMSVWVKYVWDQPRAYAQSALSYRVAIVNEKLICSRLLISTAREITTLTDGSTRDRDFQWQRRFHPPIPGSFADIIIHYVCATGAAP